MIFGWRDSSVRISTWRRSVVMRRLSREVTMLMTSAPPTAGQNPETVNPFTRYAVSSNSSALRMTRNNPRDSTIRGRVNTNRTGRMMRFRIVRTSTAARPEPNPSASIPGRLSTGTREPNGYLAIQATKY